MTLPSVFLSLFRNKNQLYFLIGLISLVTISIILVSVLTIYISESELRAWQKPLNSFTIAEPRVNSINHKTLNELNSLKVIDNYMKFMDSIISVPGILNTEYRPVIAIDIKNMDKFLEYNNFKLVEGELPQSNTREIVISKNISDSKKLFVDDYVGNSINKNEFLWGRFKVSGIYEGEFDIGLASLKYFQRRMGDGFSLLFFPIDNLEKMNSKLISSNFNSLQFETNKSLIKNNSEKNKSLLDLIYIIISILTISLTIIVGLYISLYLKTRLKEFALYYSRGIPKKNIIIFVLKELFLVALISQLLGVLFSQLIISYLRNFTFENLIFSAHISLFDIALIFPLFISIIVVSLVITYFNLKNKNLERIIMGD